MPENTDNEVNTDLIATVLTLSYTQAVKDTVTVLHTHYDLSEGDVATQLAISQAIMAVSKLCVDTNIDKITKNLIECLRENATSIKWSK